MAVCDIELSDKVPETAEEKMCEKLAKNKETGDAENDEAKKLAEGLGAMAVGTGLGVGLGVGIPLLVLQTTTTTGQFN